MSARWINSALAWVALIAAATLVVGVALGWHNALGAAVVGCAG